LLSIIAKRLDKSPISKVKSPSEELRVTDGDEITLLYDLAGEEATLHDEIVCDDEELIFRALTFTLASI